jgi:hypothetical protein
MTEPTVVRPETDFNAAAHAYALRGEKLPGISTISKMGETETWGIASAWAFKIGVNGAAEVLGVDPGELRAKLQARGLTPWATRDKAAERGNWVHDVLEGLGQSGEIPDLSKFSEEVQGHARAVLRWYLDYRPSFVSTEVQVVSEKHRFAGRYDIRCHLRYIKELGPPIPPPEPGWLALVDLKTSKDVYPTQHFAQLEGYELASVEMGFPRTDVRYVLNTKPDGTYKFVRSWANGDHFLAYLSAHNAVLDIQSKDPEVARTAEREVDILGQLPSRFKDLTSDLESGPLGGLLRSMQKRGLVGCEKGLWSRL